MSHPNLVAIVPAYNEAADIGVTIDSLKTQTMPPSRVIVVANNCTDNTAEVAEYHGAEVMVLPNNPAKKAGALNAALDQVLQESEVKYVLLMDGDSKLAPDFIENGMTAFQNQRDLGGLSGAIKARKANNIVELAQAIEYMRGTRNMGRANGKVHVLSGASTILKTEVLRKIAERREMEGPLGLPGKKGDIFIEGSLTEDFELTLAVRAVGHLTRSTKRCVVETDLMKDLKMLRAQRIRWYRGALESLSMYGFGRLTWKEWIGVGFGYLQSLAVWATLAVISYYFISGYNFNSWVWWLTIPVFVVEQVVNARRVSRKAVWVSLTLVPLWCFDNLRSIYTWEALGWIIFRRKKVWIST